MFCRSHLRAAHKSCCSQNSRLSQVSYIKLFLEPSHRLKKIIIKTHILKKSLTYLLKSRSVSCVSVFYESTLFCLARYVLKWIKFLPNQTSILAALHVTSHLTPRLLWILQKASGNYISLLWHTVDLLHIFIFLFNDIITFSRTTVDTLEDDVTQVSVCDDPRRRYLRDQCFFSPVWMFA